MVVSAIENAFLLLGMLVRHVSAGGTLQQVFGPLYFLGIATTAHLLIGVAAGRETDVMANNSARWWLLTIVGLALATGLDLALGWFATHHSEERPRLRWGPLIARAIFGHVYLIVGLLLAQILGTYQAELITVGVAGLGKVLVDLAMRRWTS